MASLPVYDKSGKKVGSYEIDPEQIAPEINKQLLHDAVLMYQANRRQGSHRTKNRAEVSGTNKKMYRQKGTGNARAGAKRSGVRRGGGHIFAIRPRDYSYRLPKKALRLATRMALAGKIRDEQVVVIDDLSMDQPQTKAIVGLLKALEIEGKSALIATGSYNQEVYKSARNIQKVSVAEVNQLNAFTVLAPHRVLMTKAALDAIKQESADKCGPLVATADNDSVSDGSENGGE